MSALTALYFLHLLIFILRAWLISLLGMKTDTNVSRKIQSWYMSVQNTKSLKIRRDLGIIIGDFSFLFFDPIFNFDRHLLYCIPFFWKGRRLSRGWWFIYGSVIWSISNGGSSAYRGEQFAENSEFWLSSSPYPAWVRRPKVLWWVLLPSFVCHGKISGGTTNHDENERML